MSGNSRIVFDGVWKKFHRGETHDSLRDLIPALTRRMLGRAQPKSTDLSDGDFWAVRDLSFEVVPGQTLGIIGPNGSGKSTTLRMLTKILEPTIGRAEVQGRMGALIEVSAGFHGDLTGRENVFLQGAIMGMRAKQIEERFDDIVEFSGIPEFIDTPVKRYSSGMNARLGFAIAAHLEPDVLIIDEVLAVGDMSFQERAFGRIKELARSGIPVVIVSHQLERVVELCTDAILLRKGQVAFRGAPTETIGAYVQHVDVPTAPEGAEGTPTIEFTAAQLTDDRPVRSGETCTIEISARVAERLRESIEPLQVRVRSLQTGKAVFMTGSQMLGVSLDEAGAFRVRLSLQMNVAPGSYMVEATAFDAASQKLIAHAPPVAIQVINAGTFRGLIALNPELTVVSSNHR